MMLTRPRLLGETLEILTDDTVMVACPTPPVEDEAFGLIRVGLSLVAESLGFLMADPVLLVSGETQNSSFIRM